MAAAISVISVFSGAALAVAADRMPFDRAAIERAGGMFMLTGLALLGGALRHFC